MTEHDINWDDDTISRLWDYYSKTPPYNDAYFAKHNGRQILKKSELPLQAEYNVLDFGSGLGWMLQHLVSINSSWQYTAIDFSEESIKAVIQRGKEIEQFKGAYPIKSFPLKFPDETYDVIFLIEVVEHLSDEKLNITLKESYRLLRKGGYVIITTPNEENLSVSNNFCPECGAVYHQWQHVRSWSKDTLSDYMHRYGFKDENVKTLSFAANFLSLKGILYYLMRKTRILLRKQQDPNLLAIYKK